MADDVLKKVATWISEGKGRPFIGRSLGLSEFKTRRLMEQARASGAVETIPVPKTPEEAIERDGKLSQLSHTLASLQAKYKVLLEQLEQYKTREGATAALQELVGHVEIPKIAIHKKGIDSESTAFMIASDWHWEETVEAATVNGLNRYDIDIARSRAKQFFQNGLKLVEMCRSKSKINTLVLALLGDMITGYIHDELVESNQMSPVQAIFDVFCNLVAGIDFLDANGEFDHILIPTCCGNHGRTTIKPRVSTATQNSYEWLLYRFLADHYRDHPRVRIQVAEAYFSYMECYGKIIRFHHGDDIRYQGGIGGIHVPLNKAIAAWNKAKLADLDVLGHWHSRMSHGNYVVNGSLIGYSPYAIKIKADYEVPCQAFFLMHPKRGKTVECPIHVQ